MDVCMYIRKTTYRKNFWLFSQSGTNLNKLSCKDWVFLCNKNDQSYHLSFPKNFPQQIKSTCGFIKTKTSFLTTTLKYTTITVNSPYINIFLSVYANLSFLLAPCLQKHCYFFILYLYLFYHTNHLMIRVTCCVCK